MFNVYCDLKLPDLNPNLLRHKKEQMVFMIVNMVRTQPKLYIQYMSILQDRCLQRQSPQNLAFRYEDVDDAISLLKEMEPRHALKLSSDLCIYSINMLDRDSDLICSLDQNCDEPLSKDQCSPKTKKSNLRAQQKQLINKYKKVKQMTIDYFCREDLTVTTLKEFFEIFISSLRKDQAFH